MNALSKIIRSVSYWLLLFPGVFALLQLPAPAQVRPVYDYGAIGLVQALKRLNTSASVMMIGAHPDDEDTALLAYLARGESARTAYLSLTRGDGGQNIIGPELGEALGVIRTEELLQARRLDGAEQYFTRAYDYGFSKTLAEAQQKWDEKVILCDAVKAIRDFKPLVVVSQFSGTPSDGHGQHQFAGYIAPLAVKAAADPLQCADAGPTWQVRKYYARHRGQREPTLRINTGKYDPLLGRSYFEIAMEARSQHKSQEQGVLELRGEIFSGLNLLQSEATETNIFTGLDTSIAGFAKYTLTDDDRFARQLERIQTVSARAISEYDVRAPEKLIPTLVDGYRLTTDPEWTTRLPGPNSFPLQKRADFLNAIKLAGGIQVDAISDNETVVAGEGFTVATRIFYPKTISISVKSVTLETPQGWTVESSDLPSVQTQGFARRENPNFGRLFTVRVADSAGPTQPYWLEHPRQGDMFDWRPGMNRTFPFGAPIAQAVIKMDILGKEVVLNQPVEFRYADDIRGEIRRPLSVVPRLAVELDQSLMIVASSDRSATKELSVAVTNHSQGAVAGTIALSLPAGWTASPAAPAFDLQRPGEKTSIRVLITVPQVARGEHRISASALTQSGKYDTSMRVMAYPHIQTHRSYSAPTTKVNVLDLKVAKVRVGYIAGSGDRTPEAMRQLGLEVSEIDEKTLASVDLTKFDTVVVGIRAYQVRQDVVANNKRLLDFANSGGTLIVQYQLPAYAQQKLTPYEAQMGPRTSEEDAAITILHPDHAIFNYPNKITQSDFDGWVQERNLYNFSTMDAKYTGLLESHDAGEAANTGGLVIADVGKGKYIYCSYSLFRQLPAGVSGAYRLFANMLSLPKAKK